MISPTHFKRGVMYSVFSRNAGLGIEGRVSDLARLRWQCPSVPPFVSASVARCQPPTHLTSPHPTQTLKSFDFILTKIRSSHVKYNKKIFNTFTRIKIYHFAIKFFVPILGFLNKSEVPERQNCPQKLKHSGYFFLFSYFQDKILRKFDRFSFWERFVQILKSIFRKLYLRTLLFHRVSKLLRNSNRF